MTAKISIVIPAYNAERFLALAIDSVLAQSFEDWELVVVNDGSKDSTAEIIKSYEVRDSRIRSLHQQNAGVSAARNTGFAASSPEAPFVIFLDQDDVWEQEALASLFQSLANSKDGVASQGLARFIGRNGEINQQDLCENMCRPRPTFDGKKVAPLPLEQPSTFATFIVSCPTPTPGTVLMKKEYVVKVGGFDSNYPQCQDWDLYIRLSRHGSFEFLNKVVLGYRVHGGNVSANRDAQREEMKRVLKQAISSPDNSPEQQTIANKSYRSLQLFQIREKLKFAKDELTNRQPSNSLRQLLYAGRHAVNLVRGLG